MSVAEACTEPGTERLRRRLILSAGWLPPSVSASRAILFLECQTARNRDPGSACKKGPLTGVGIGLSRHESDGAMRGRYLCGRRASRGGAQARFLKHQLALPVSMISQ